MLQTQERYYGARLDIRYRVTGYFKLMLQTVMFDTAYDKLIGRELRRLLEITAELYIARQEGLYQDYPVRDSRRLRRFPTTCLLYTSPSPRDS